MNISADTDVGTDEYQDYLDDNDSTTPQTPTRRLPAGLERVAVHPLQQNTYDAADSDITMARSSDSINSESYLRSAAKTLLDDAALGGQGGLQERQKLHPDDHPLASPSLTTLKSLETQKLPPMPDEQDRKRFVGGLAAVLACAYDFDSIQEDDDLLELMRAEESLALMDVNDGEARTSANSMEGLHPQQGPILSEPSFEYAEGSATFDHMQDMSYRDSSNHINQSARRLSRRERDRIQVARTRHRKRRYDVLSKLLIQSADYLMIESGQAKAFLPMLSKLMVPSKSANVDKTQRRRRGPSVRSSNASQGSTSTIGSTIESQQSFSGVHDDLQNRIDEIDHLRPFLESLTPGAGLRCVALCMIQHLLRSETGYDARIRHALKKMGVLVLVHDMERDPIEAFAEQADKNKHLIALATRKFESLEHHIAKQLLQLSKEQEQNIQQSGGPGTTAESSNTSTASGLALEKTSKQESRQRWIRGLKIGGTAVVAGTLFAVTGGLAAPGIAAGLAAVAGTTAATAVVGAILSSSVAVTTIFGVGGGGLAAYKMNRRTRGLTEFEFTKETGPKYHEQPNPNESGPDQVIEAELFSTVCLSGWLRDKSDFQRPWGVSPTNPPIESKKEILERFYVVHRPDHVGKSEKLLEQWEGEEDTLWELIRKKYGRDPDHLFPLLTGPRYQGALTHEQVEVVQQLFIELKYAQDPSSRPNVPATDDHDSGSHPFERRRFGWKKRGQHKERASLSEQSIPSQPISKPVSRPTPQPAVEHADSYPAFDEFPPSTGLDSISTSSVSNEEGHEETSEIPKHLSTVWDYQAQYGGEMYTVRWESRLLQELCDSVSDLALGVVQGGTTQILKHTAFSALLSAMAWPAALVHAANMIDGTWTLAVERADEAGKELARSLLFSRAGNRPLTLVGFSFGARAIYSCLKELARFQEQWEDYQERKMNSGQQPQGRGRPRMNRNARQDPETDEDSFFEHMREPASIVEDAIIMGLPNHLSLLSWKACRQVVAGRLVNCFSQKDLILSLMFQFKRLGMKPVCGTTPVDVNGVENIDCTDLITAHEEYTLKAGDILKRVRLAQPFRSTRTFQIENADGPVVPLNEPSNH